jgi:tripartite-type tricarboxylate transporter receptor subunit TctC
MWNLVFDGFIVGPMVAQQGRAHCSPSPARKAQPGQPRRADLCRAGPANYEATTWNNLFAPARTPADVVARLNDALNKALATQPVKDRLAQGASESLGPSTPEQADAYGQAQRARWVPFVRALGIEPG